MKYLGVHVDYSLSWKDHLKSVTSKLSRGMGMLKQAKYHLPDACFKTLFEYCGALLPVLLFCLGNVWGYQKKQAFKSFKIELLELSPTANLMLRADHLCKDLDGKPSTSQGWRQKFSGGGTDSSDEGAKIWYSGYYKCQKSPKKSLFTFRQGASILRRGL